MDTFALHYIFHYVEYHSQNILVFQIGRFRKSLNVVLYCGGMFSAVGEAISTGKDIQLEDIISK